jgi:hypothetical protein
MRNNCLRVAVIGLMLACSSLAQQSIILSLLYQHVQGPTGQVLQIKSSSGTLHLVLVNSAGAGCLATLYDTANQGTTAVIAVLDCTQVREMSYDLIFSNGLAVLVTGGTSDLTITYR